MERPIFSPRLTNARAATPYPHVEILDKSESIALLLKTFNGGELPIVYNHEGSKIQIAKVDYSAIVICELMKVSRLVWNVSAEESTELIDTDAVMSALQQYIKGR